jgi:predicted ferric reductase/Ca2+-binding EF-hand superfamily protein
MSRAPKPDPAFSPASAIDARLIASLERAFAAHAGSDGVIDEAELQRALGFRSSYLAKRVLALFDRNGDGLVQRDEFIAWAKRLINGDVREKLWFAFQLHDHDGDGFIDQTEMFRMISIAMAESEIVARASQPAEHLTHVLFRALDSNRDGRISFDELESAVRKRPELLRKMTQSEAIWLAPNEDLFARLNAASAAPAGSRVAGWLRNHWAVVFFCAAWLASNLAILSTFFLHGVTSGAPLWMQLGRTLGLALDFNGALILIPMMRRLLTRVRASFLGRLIPVDHSIAFHRLLGHTLFTLGVAHAACFTLAYAGGHALHPISDLFLTTGRGFTGLALLTVFFVMWLFSLAFVRRSKRFELFYFTHLLYLAWLALAIAHAPSFALWALVPLLGFAVEQFLRLRRRAAVSRVVSSSPLRSAVTRLEIERPPGFEFAAADYVFLRIPAIARHEWHPFTLSSAPEHANLVVHARSLGNWTSALRHAAEVEQRTPLIVHVDGPYGSPSAHIFRSRVAVLIGAGIGVTPFASVLESLVLRANGQSAAPSQLEKVEFFWINRDQYSFEWFMALLADLEGIDQKGLLDIHLCMTGANAGATALGLELARDVMHASGRSDMITGLRTHTHVGRPDWNAMLGAIAARHQPDQVDVYFCGPPGLGALLSRLSRRLGMSFREEKF